jgi:hypothetical protein
MAGGAALSTTARRRAWRPRTILAGTLGALAALLVLFTLVLLALDGHPEGLLCLVAGAAAPALLWGAWRLGQGVRGRAGAPRTTPVPETAPPVPETAPPAPADLVVTRSAEVNVVLERTVAIPRDGNIPVRLVFP